MTGSQVSCDSSGKQDLYFWNNVCCVLVFGGVDKGVFFHAFLPYFEVVSINIVFLFLSFFILFF